MPIMPAVVVLSLIAGWAAVSLGGICAFIVADIPGVVAWITGWGTVLLLRNANPEHVCLCGRCAGWHCRQ
jgi:hypothetical protein